MSRLNRWLAVTGLGVALVAAWVTTVQAGEAARVRRPPPSTAATGTAARIIVKLRARSSVLSAATAGGARQGPLAAAALSQRLGLALADGHALDTDTQVITATGLSSAALAQRVAGDPAVEWAVIDERRYPLAAPSDPLYPDNNTAALGPVSGQWYLRAPTATVLSGVDIETAWGVTHGTGSSIVLADLDTGITAHPDLDSKWVSLGGFNFISDANVSNGVATMSRDPYDPGDWVTATENSTTGGPFFGCNDGGTGAAVGSNSSWHGTQTAGILAAATNNGLGMAGTAYDLQFIPVRVLGKCGGYDSDIINGMRWAAGLSVPGVASNPHPARVLNMSLGSAAACTPSYQAVLTQLRNLGVVVVAAAGNDSVAVGAPANCQPATTDPDQTPIIVAVAALRHTGTKVGFSDLGPQVTISAPGGNCVNPLPGQACLYPILSTTNTGTTSPVAPSYTNAYNYGVGTSFSTPIVAGTVGLMLAANPALTNAQVIGLLKATATAFPASSPTTTTVCQAPPLDPKATTPMQDECICTTSTCGAGMLNAGRAVTAAASLALPTPAISGGTTVAVGGVLALSGAGSTVPSGRTVASYQWQLASGGTFASLGGANGATVNLTGLAAGTAVVQLTVIDSFGASASTTSQVTVTASASSGNGGGGGGGGALQPVWLLGLLACIVALGPRRRARADRGAAASRRD